MQNTHRVITQRQLYLNICKALKEIENGGPKTLGYHTLYTTPPASNHDFFFLRKKTEGHV